MRAILQRLSRAEALVASQLIGAIGRGLVVLLGVGRGDTEGDADFPVEPYRRGAGFRR